MRIVLPKLALLLLLRWGWLSSLFYLDTTVEKKMMKIAVFLCLAFIASTYGDFKI